MMEEATLTPRRGRKNGPEVVLDKTRLRIGVRADCDVVLQGDFVSEVHATLERQQDDWVLVNVSPHGTYVNRDAVTRHTLRDGDQIQVGAENLLIYAAPTRMRAGREDAAEAGSGLAQLLKLDNPAVLAGLAVYAIVMLAGVVFLMSRGAEAPGAFSRAHVDQVLEATAEVLASEDFASQASVATPLLPAGDPAALYHRLLRVAAAGDHSSQSALAEELAREAGSHVMRGWHLEGQRRWREAAQEYTQIIERLPDQRIAITRLALDRRRTARGQSNR
jgi:hypothetical protein